VRPSLARRLVALGVVPALVFAACGGGGNPAPASYPPGAIVVTAESQAFDTAELVVPAGRPFTLVFVNRDSAQHNIAIRTEQGFEGDLVFRFDPISASTVTLEVGPIPAGTYFFLCEAHPFMTGTVIAN
jgi:plastocyanin